MFKYEHHKTPLLPRSLFIRRMIKHGVLGFGFILTSVVAGVLGYHYLEDLKWIDALLNASMIAGGMGPVDPMKTDAGKVFASFYAIYSGMVLIAASGVLLAPIFHRIMHGFHQESVDISA